jgi:hypothetical protein
MVREATRMGSTPSSPALQRATARTILLTSTGSNDPSRLRTRIGLVSVSVIAIPRSCGPIRRPKTTTSGIGRRDGTRCAIDYMLVTTRVSTLQIGC